MACALALPASAGAARPTGLGQSVGDARLLVHYTTGGPYFAEYERCEYAREWFDEKAHMLEVKQRARAAA